MTISDQDVTEALARLDAAEAALAQVRALLARTPGGIPPMDARTADRVARFGRTAHLHLAHIEEHGYITRAESLQIRREIFGDKVQSTANLFGREGSGALFWRDQPYETPVHDDDRILLTDEGARIATLWRAMHLEM